MSGEMKDGGAFLRSMRVAPQTKNRIDTAEGSISVNWSEHPSDNPYARAEKRAAEIVMACNAYVDLVAFVSDFAERDPVFAKGHHKDDIRKARDLIATLSSTRKGGE